MLVSSLSLPAAAQGNSHDGKWRVEIQTTVGACQKSGVVTVEIKGARIAGIDVSGVDPWGYIDDSNTFVGHFNQGEHVLRANGDVKGSSASGPWSSQTDYCGGRWTARKID
jgi:hypothetical protein